jgi:multiple antibiotic resistance protein
MSSITRLAEVFVPLFVALSPLTVLPIFLGMTDGMELRPARKLARRAVATGLVIAIVVVLLGQGIFKVLGITVDDLRVAGGIILLLIAIHDLIFTRERRKANELGSDVGVVPLGTPLIVGPATMATCLVLADSYGKLFVVAALSINLFVIGLLLHFANRIQGFVGPSVSRAFGKVMSLFLAAIAVAMLRSGIQAFVSGI